MYGGEERILLEGAVYRLVEGAFNSSQRENFTNFGDFLWYALEHSKCDGFAKEQFRHAADGVYCEGNNVREFYCWIERWELEVDGEIDTEGQTVR